MKKAGRVSQQTRGSIQRVRLPPLDGPAVEEKASEEGGRRGVELEQEGEESRDKAYEDEDFGTQGAVTTISII